MTRLTWDPVGERFYETGVDRGVLFQLDSSGDYVDGVPWNGLTTVTESPSGAESNKQYADNLVYVNLISAEEFGGTIEAFTYPDEFAANDGTAVVNGVALSQQGRRPFGLAYRTLKGNDTDGQDHGYKLHLVYGAQASPSERAYATVNDSPEAISFSWEFTTTPVAVDGHKPTALLVVDSTKVAADDLAALEDIIWGSEGDDPRLPSPDEVLALFGAGVTNVDLTLPANQPTFVAERRVAAPRGPGTGRQGLAPGVGGPGGAHGGGGHPRGAAPAVAPGAQAVVEARALEGNNLQGDDQWTFRRDA